MLSNSQQLKLLDILKENKTLAADRHEELKQAASSNKDVLEELQKDKTIDNEAVAQAVAQVLGLSYQSLKKVTDIFPSGNAPSGSLSLIEELLILPVIPFEWRA